MCTIGIKVSLTCWRQVSWQGLGTVKHMKLNATGLEIYENKEMFVEMCLEEK